MKKRFKVTIRRKDTFATVTHYLWSQDLKDMQEKAQVLSDATKAFESMDIEELDENYEDSMQKYKEITGENKNEH